MDWIERLFGVSPDNGSGTTETLIGLAIAAATAGLVVGLNVFGLRDHLARLAGRVLRR